MGAASSNRKKAKRLTKIQLSQREKDLVDLSDEDKTTFEEDDDPLSLAGDFVEDDGGETK